MRRSRKPFPQVHFLTKTDFKVARSCPTKLYYKKAGYPSTKEDDPYMAFLANGGHIVGKIAQILYPGGKLVSSIRSKSAIEETEELLQNEDITIFEPAITSDGMLVRIDILIKRGSHFDLIEVKSKSGDSRDHENGLLFHGKRGGIESGLLFQMAGNTAFNDVEPFISG